MTSRDLFELTARNLRGSILRSSLTTLGIAVGVASLVSMLSLGIGLQRMASKRLLKSGLFDTIVVTSRREARNGFREERKARAPAAEPAPLDEAARQQFAKIPNVVEALPDVRFGAELRCGDRPRRTSVAGLPASAKTTDAFEGVRGRFFSEENAAEVILQKSFAAELLGTPRGAGPSEPDAAELAKALVGKDLSMSYAERSPGAADMSMSIAVRTTTLRIVGIVDLDPESIRGPGRARVFVPFRFAQSLNGMQISDLREGPRMLTGAPTYTAVNVRVKSPAQVQAVEDAIKKLGFGTFSILDATRSLQQIFGVVDLFLGAFGSLALAVASIGIVNTLIMAILERRREIGIMKAIGASDRAVKTIFLAEAGAMGLAGGIAGVGMGWAIGRIINAGTDIYLSRQGLPSEQIWYVPFWLVGAAIAFAIVVSLVSGWYPAARAARLDPVQTLRYE